MSWVLISMSISVPSPIPAIVHPSSAYIRQHVFLNLNPSSHFGSCNSRVNNPNVSDHKPMENNPANHIFSVARVQSRATTGLHTAIIAKGRTFFGAALTLRYPADTAELAIVNNHADFGSITPENAMKWESTEPSRGVYTFANADAIRDYAAVQKKQIHCHTLVWHSQLPAWVSGGNFDNATLISIMYDHIKAVAGRYKGACTRWDVVNEGEWCDFE